MRALVIGELEAARRVCGLLRDSGCDVHHLIQPTDAELRVALDRGVDGIAIVVRGDVVALRYALLIEHLRPGIRLLVTVFDKTVAGQLRRVVPNCVITSPSDAAVPSIIAACLGGDALAVDIRSTPPQVLSEAGLAPWRRLGRRRGRPLATAISRLRTSDTHTRLLLAGLFGLLTVLVTDFLIATVVLGHDPVRALYIATRIVATVGPGEPDLAPAWYLVLSSGFMLLTIAFTALLTAGLVERFLGPRGVSIVGARALPTHDHVVVVGLGQVGLRLCTQLRQLGIPVVAIERDPEAANLRLARAAQVPVLIAHAEDRATLDKLALSRARALAAMSALDADNVEVAIAALAVAPRLRVVLRAGEDEVVAETRSLFPIGEVQDVSALTALQVALSLLGRTPSLVYGSGASVRAHPAVEPAPPAAPARCDCRPRLSSGATTPQPAARTSAPGPRGRG